MIDQDILHMSFQNKVFPAGTAALHNTMSIFNLRHLTSSYVYNRQIRIWQQLLAPHLLYFPFLDFVWLSYTIYSSHQVYHQCAIAAMLWLAT